MFYKNKIVDWHHGQLEPVEVFYNIPMPKFYGFLRCFTDFDDFS